MREAGEVSTDRDRPLAENGAEAALTTAARSGQPLWRYVARRGWRKFIGDQCVDLAAGLTFYAIISIFPAVLAMLTLLSVIGEAESAVTTALSVIEPLVDPQRMPRIEAILRDFSGVEVSGWALLGSVALSLWTASGYVNAFSRAMNRILEVPEGRPIWKLRPAMFAVTLVLILLVAALLTLLTISGGLARSIGGALGLGSQAQWVWSVAKWPAFGIVAAILTAVLYWATPNVRHSRKMGLSVGAAVAVLVWLVASAGLSFYVARFADYNRTYGSVAGVIVALLFLFVSNLALLIGAEVDAELERVRQLRDGLEADSRLQLPLRATKRVERVERWRQDDLAYARELRRTRARSSREAGSPDS